MDAFTTYLVLFSVIVIVGQLFQRSNIPIGLILVIVGMLLSYAPFFSAIHLESKLVLNIFLPLLIYEISAFSSWHDMKKNLRPIALLSIGHVVFITLLVAYFVHLLIPQMGWPIAFLLGAIISPPDDVAIVSIAEKIRIPKRIFIILEGEGMFNDAAALTIFKLALAAVITHQFYFSFALFHFVIIMVGEVIYGLLLGHVLGFLRIRITNTTLHQIVSFMTPFLAYIPIAALGGTGVISTAIVGFLMGNKYTLHFTSAYRLSSFSIWPSLAFTIQSLLFLLVGLNMQSTINRISSIPFSTLLLYALTLTAVVIIGRFIWVYGAVSILPRLLFPSLRKKDPYPPWQYPFIISWAGTRGAISLAAALAVPALFKIDGVDARDLIIFFVFFIIVVTLVVQGLSLPYVLKKMGIDKVSQSERHREHITELQARLRMVKVALNWLQALEKKSANKKIYNEVIRYVGEYSRLKNEFELRIQDHHESVPHDEASELYQKTKLISELSEIEKLEISKLWREGKISIKTRNKLLGVLDHRLERHLI